MPRRPCRGTGQYVFHVFNRAIQGLVLFEEAWVCRLFLSMVRQSAERARVRILAYCVMPNHWHLVVWPTDDTGLSRFMQLLTGKHARRWRWMTGTIGRGAVYQGRFKAIPVRDDYHLLRVCRYVERNPLRGKLVARAEDWAWSSASSLETDDDRPVLAEWPVTKPPDWLDLLNVPQPTQEVAAIREAIRRNLPYGDVTWQSDTIGQLRWPVGRRRAGRPRHIRPSSQAVVEICMDRRTRQRSERSGPERHAP